MSITKDNFIVVYNIGDLDSLDFALYYASKHDMETSSSNPSENSGTIGGIYWEVNGQMLGINFSDNSEILSSESDFNAQVLNPINDAISNSTDLLNRSIYGIVLGYNTPGGFYDGEDIISSTSRISRRNEIFSKKYKNKLYNRSIFKRFDSDDAEYAIICSRIDAPNLQACKAYLDNAEILNNQLFANGVFYIDPYSDRACYGSEEYQENLIDFYNNLIPTLNLDTWSTSFVDPYIDVSIPFVENDSFVWSWFSDRATSSFFRNSNSVRVFFYNADYDGGLEMRNENGRRWPYLSMDAGYVCAAGSLSNPSIGGFLNPIPFFNALLRGATIGEAYIFSLPYLDWTMSLFGDPLTYCSFPGSSVEDEELIGEHSLWEKTSKDISKIAAYLYKKENEIREILENILNRTSSDPSVGAAEAEISLLYTANDLYINNDQNQWTSQLKSLVDCFFDFPRKRYSHFGTDELSPDINSYLSEHDFKVSRLLSSISSSSIISEENLLDEGWWEFEFEVSDDSGEFTNYHFILEVYSDALYTNLIFSKDSYSLTSWKYEKEKDSFVDISFSGVSSSYIGRKVKYTSVVDDLLMVNEYLTRGETYYFKVIQYNIETMEQYTPKLYEEIVYT